ncbi:MAG TPA: TRC40/GET3/ArsA family transport-energizing ATPase [Anaerolineae bacterium]|nr:TRC40/GET3/ArsA family transport-energizing ATPase [Anaerolineae bacterium]
MSSRFIFFSGKGGVGKTSMACASAVRHADEGHKTLIVTTDPASNLADVFEQAIGHKITPIQGLSNLSAMEIDPDKATDEYKERALAPIRAVFPPQMVQVIEEQMSGPCTAEVAAFDRFTDFLDVPASPGVQAFDVVIFDTAPTGHTLRLLELPAAWVHTIEQSSTANGQTCIGPSAAIQASKLKYERALSAMRDSTQTTFIFVLQPEATPIKETKRATGELAKLDIHTHQLIVNGILPPEEASNPFFAQRVAMQEHYLDQIARELPLPARRMFLLDGEIKGVARLRQVAEVLFDARPRPRTQTPACPQVQVPIASPRSDVLTRVEPNGHRRVVFFAGKGGVGKTSASCVTAVWLARQGYETLLLTTDPAAHLGDVLGVPVGDEARPIAGVSNLWAAKIDPKGAAEAYKARILDDARQRGRPPEAIKAMAEELDSPCTEEMAAFDKFIDFASQEQWDSIVFDTAPTGHTLRLLELPIDWSKQLDVKIFASVDTAAADDVAKKRFGQVIQMMRDPDRSTFAFVMYPESTPIVEAYRAVQELRTVGIEPGLAVANLVLPPEECTTPYTQARRAMQEKYLAEIAQRFAVPILHIPLLPHEVKGLDVLTKLGDQVYGNRGEGHRNTSSK